jgi:hypothetical protein
MHTAKVGQERMTASSFSAGAVEEAKLKEPAAK